MSTNHVKNLFYSSIFYLDNSTEAEILSILKSMKIPCLVSPLHDSDVVTERDVEKWNKKHPDEVYQYNVGDLKKPHYHVIFKMPYPKQPKSSLLYVNALLPSSYELNFIEPIGFLNLYCRYLYHADQPDKHLYNKDDIVNFHNFPSDFDLPSPPKSKRICRNELMQSIRDNPGISCTGLVSIFMEDDEMMTYIERNAYFVKILVSEGQK